MTVPAGSADAQVPQPHLGRAASVRRAGGRTARRLRAHGSSLLLAAAAAGTAYLLASLVVGAANAVFAPVAAVVATGLSAGQRVLRAVEISTGVVLGITAADLLTRLVGVGPLLIALAVLLAMTAAVAIRPSGLMANQAAVAAVVVVALVPYLEAGPWVRLADALIGGAVAVVLNAVVSPDPLRAGRTVVVEVLCDYAAVLRRLRDALRSGSLEEAEAALSQFNGLDGAEDEIRDSLLATRTRLQLAQTRRRSRDASRQSIAGFGERVVVLVATGRALSRATANLVRHDDEQRRAPRDQLTEAFEELIAAIEALLAWVSTDVGSDDGVRAARNAALRAAAAASSPPPSTQAAAVVTGQLRSAAIDILRITGMDQSTAVAALEAAAGRADTPRP